MHVPKIFAILAGVYIVGQFLYIVYYAIGLVQFNPFVKLKPLTPSEKQVLTDNFPIYRKLPEVLRARCEERIKWFRSRKKFVFYGAVSRQEDIKLILSGSLVLMTLGLKNYKMRRSLIRVIVYPSQYYSRISRRHHLGEYNPFFKTVVFSAEQLWEGFRIPNDNINLAMHEFAHALSYEMKRKGSWEAMKFRVGFREIHALLAAPLFREQMAATGYFREYGMTNTQEFFSVAVENYVETPQQFDQDFPELYGILKRMLKFEFR